MDDVATPLEPERVPLVYSGVLRRAIRVAERAHRGVNRKSGDYPYFLHLIAVAQVLAAAGADDDLLCAAYLHDAVEDTAISDADIQDDFGQRVADLVGAVTKPSIGVGGRRLSAEERDARVLVAMETTQADVLALKAADLVANMTDLILDQRSEGYAHWHELFGERAGAKLEHYTRLAGVLGARLEEMGRYPQLVAQLRARARQLGELRDAWGRPSD